MNCADALRPVWGMSDGCPWADSCCKSNEQALTNKLYRTPSLTRALPCMTFSVQPPMPALSTGLNVHDLWRLLEHMDDEDSSALAWQMQAHIKKLRTSLPDLRMVCLVSAYWEHLDRLCQAWILARPQEEDVEAVKDIVSRLARKITIRTWFLYVDHCLDANTSYLRGSRLPL